MSGPLVSVVMPVLDESRVLSGALTALAALPGRWEIVVVDGGSSDGTAEAAAGHPARPLVVRTGPGRASQMNVGAAAARGEVLLFLHADTTLPRSAHASIGAAFADPEVLGGNFSLRFDGADAFGRILTGWYAAQRRLGVYYGDSGVWLRRAAWDALGGFRPLAIMEDYDLVRRLERRGRTRRLPGPAVTSGRRWRVLGVPRTVGSWVAIRWLWLLGVPPDRLVRLYRHAR